jgi:elongator complex protein 4
MVTAQLSHVSPSDRIRMMHLADSVISLEAVDDTSQVVKLSTDSRTVSGLARICKLPAAGALIAPSPQITCYVVRNKRRRLAISPIEIDPDAEAQQLEADAVPLPALTGSVGTTQQYEF